MEIFIDSVEDKAEFVDANGNFLDIHEWPGVRMNEADEIEDIKFRIPEHAPNFLEGVLNFLFLPDSVTALDLSNNRLSGSLALCDLPPAFADFNATGNNFEGKLTMRICPTR